LRKQDPAGSAAVPGTLYGCYVAASLLGDAARVARLSSEVRRLYSVGRDQDVIIQSVFHHLVMGYFGPAAQALQVERFTAQLTALPGRGMPSRQDMEEVLLEKLGLIPPRWAFVDRLDELFQIWMVVGWRIVSVQPVAADEVLRRVAEAEADAVASGVHLMAASW
jgi:hypothetical protein